MWVKLDDNMSHHPKIFEAGLEAFGFFTALICYANRNRSLGFISANHVTMIFPGIPRAAALKLIDRLVRARKAGSPHGLMRAVDGGWMIHDYDEYQKARSPEEERDLRATRAEAGRRGGHRSGLMRANRGATPKQLASPVLQTKRTPAPAPAPAPENGSEHVFLVHSESFGAREPNYSARDGAADALIGFDRFWEAWPKERRLARGQAEEAYASENVQGAKHIDAIVKSVQEQTKGPDTRLNPKNGPSYIPMPTKWLNGWEWTNEAHTGAPKRHRPRRTGEIP